MKPESRVQRAASNLSATSVSPLAKATRANPISANEHRQIVKAIASGDAEAAGKAMFDHVIESKERTIKNNLLSLPRFY